MSVDETAQELFYAVFLTNVLLVQGCEVQWELDVGCQAARRGRLSVGCLQSHV